MRSPLLLTVALLALACGGGSPRFDDDAPLNVDGLRPLLNTRFDRAWARPGLDLSAYQRLWLVSEGVAYKDPPERPYGARTDSSLAPFQREELETALLAALREAFFADGTWKLAESAGADTLLLRAGLVDVVVEALPEPITVRDDVYVQSAGRATFVIELLDSRTREVLVRFADRTDFEPASGRMESNVVTNRLEVRRTLQAWSALARRRLDELRGLKLPEPAA